MGSDGHILSVNENVDIFWGSIELELVIRLHVLRLLDYQQS